LPSPRAIRRSSDCLAGRTATINVATAHYLHKRSPIRLQSPTKMAMHHD
jgi:hypothetical protein